MVSSVPGWLQWGRHYLNVAFVCWSNPRQLWQACLQVAILSEIYGRQRWQVLVVWRHVATPSHIPPGVYWTESPQNFAFCNTRFAETMGDVYHPVRNKDRFQAIVRHYYAASTLLTQGQRNGGPNILINTVAQLLCEEAMELRRPTRCTTQSEKILANMGVFAIGYLVASYTQIEGVTTPYVSVKKVASRFAASQRAVQMASSPLLYCIVHTIASMAVGLMGAASGLGLAVWLFSPRMVMSKIGAKAVMGDDTLLSILASYELRFQYTSGTGATGNAINIANDAFLSCNEASNRRAPILLAILLNSLDLLLIAGGWLYGALKVDKLAPKGLVGHGVLSLAALVATALSLRTLYSITQRVSGRLIGLSADTVRYKAIAKDCRIKFPGSSSKYLGLVSDILSNTEDDEVSMVAGLSLARLPQFCLDISQHVALKCLHYSYQGDTLVQEGNKRITTAGEYPWIQISMCVCLTFLCSVFAPVYAYVNVLPRWSKLLAEVLLAISAI